MTPPLTCCHKEGGQGPECGRPAANAWLWISPNEGHPDGCIWLFCASHNQGSSGWTLNGSRPYVPLRRAHAESVFGEGVYSGMWVPVDLDFRGYLLALIVMES